MNRPFLSCVLAFSMLSLPLASFEQDSSNDAQKQMTSYLPSLSVESQELMTNLYHFVQSEGMQEICEKMDLEPILSPSVVDLENSPPGTLLFLGDSETTIQAVVLSLQGGEYAHISSFDGVTQIEVQPLEEISISSFSYQALFRTANREVHQENVTVDSPSFPSTSTEDFLSDSFESYFVNEECLPYVISPKEAEMTLESFITWAEAHQEDLRALLTKQGAILLRGFPVEGAEEFAQVVKAAIGQDLIDYKGEGSRTRIVRGVYTSTEAPPAFKIPLHNELSCTNTPISYISFYCDVAPPAGTGQTLLGRTEDISTGIKQRPAVWNLFEGQILKYISKHPPEGSFFTRVNPSHKTWPQAFETTDKDEVARICEQKGYEFSWNGEWIEVIRHVPATRGPDEHFDHPYWFNQAYLYHPNPRIRGGWINHTLANLLYVVPSTRQYEIEFDDGTPIPQDVVYQIYDVLDEQTVLFDWNKNDVLLIDNYQVLHGRAPCYGQRRILTSMIQ